MTTRRLSAHLNAAPEDVFDFVCDIEYRLRRLGRLVELVYVDRYAMNGMRRTHQAAKELIESSRSDR